MPFQVELRSQSQILGDLIRTILTNTDLTDVAPGSSLATMLEAIAASEYQISLSALKILQATNLESLVGTTLDKKAESIKLPNGIGGVGRKPSSQASGPITIGSSFSKISTKLYAGKPAPFAGSLFLYVEDASGFLPTGVTLSSGQSYPVSPSHINDLYIGRNTIDRFEGKIGFNQITNNGSFWTVSLELALTKSHLLSDLVVLAQGGDRTVPTGTVVQIPSSNNNPAVDFTTTEELVILDGEAEGVVNVACTQFGVAGNALSGSIKNFSSAPFAGATVTNNTSFVNGKSTESDEDLRQRIKNHPSTLSRGTRLAILSAILGATDPDSGRTIQSASVLEPIEPGDFARVFIDDNTGLEPTFGRQPSESLLIGASGQETRFRTAQFPITPSLAEGTNESPFVLELGQTITIHVDEVEEIYTIGAGGSYKNINSATAYEVVRDLNAQSNIIGFRTLDGGKRIAAFDLSGKAEELFVDSGDVQKTLGLPTATLRSIFLYKDSILQSFRGHTATIFTRNRSTWDVSQADLTDVRVVVDGVTQTISITDFDFFSQFGSTIATATLTEWATVLSQKIAGVKFTISGNELAWSTWQSFSESGSIEILETKADGSAAGWVKATGMWLPSSSGGVLKDVGSTKDFKFNRFTGEITLEEKPAAGAVIEVGSKTTRAQIKSIETSNGLYSVAPLASVGNARIVVGFDGEFAVRTVGIASGTTLTPTQPDSVNATNIIRLTANSVNVFEHAELGDWLYLVKDSTVVSGWGSNVEGFYRIKAKGLSAYSSDTNFFSVPISTAVYSSLTATVKKNKNTVVVTKTGGHGFRTGDLVTISTGSAIGGISSGSLSQTNVSIIVIDDNNFQYTAGSSASADATGTLTTVGSNVITATQTLHGFGDGAPINTSASSAVGGISAGNLSVLNSQIELVDANTYKFRALAASTSSATGSLTVTYIADTWVEFEVSQSQFGDWSPLLGIGQGTSALMVYIFKSTTQPQLVDFGLIATTTVENAVNIINEAVSGGSAVKLNPQQLIIRSNDFEGGTCAVLAVVGSAGNLIKTEVASSIQAHIAHANSNYTQSGFPVISYVSLPTSQSAGYPTRSYLFVDRDLVDILDDASNPTINAPSFISNYPEGFQSLWLTGRQTGLGGRVYNNQTSSPYTGLMRGEGAIRPLNSSDTVQTSSSTLDRYSNYSLRLRDLNLNNHDKLVVEMDLNPTDKTVSVPMAKIAKIQDIDAITGSGKGQVISFRLKDPEDSNKPFFDPTSVYKSFDFADFKLLTKSVGVYREDTSDRALVLRSTSYGASNKLRLIIKFPTQPSQPNFVLSHYNDFSSSVSRSNLSTVLPSGSLIATATLSSGVYKATSSYYKTINDIRLSSGLLNSNLNYTAGNVLNISGSSGIAESYEIINSNYNNYILLSASVALNSAEITVTAPGHSLKTGDLVDIVVTTGFGGISAANLSKTGTPVYVTGSGSFTYIASALSSVAGSGTLDTVKSGNVTVRTPCGDSLQFHGYEFVSASTTNLSSTVTVTQIAHGLSTGDKISVNTTTSIGGLTSSDLSQQNTAVTVIDADTFSYVSSSAASSTATGTIESIFMAMKISAVISSSLITITRKNHGLSNGEEVIITATGSYGGLSSFALSGQFTVTVLNANQFTYNTTTNATSTVTNVDFVADLTRVNDKFSASIYNIKSWPLVNKTWTDLATAINNYLPANPIATGQAIGSALATNYIKHPTYLVYPQSTRYSGTDMSGAFLYHGFDCKFSGSAGIWQYDSSNPTLNNIKATVQSDDPIFPTSTEVSGTSYSPIDEEVYIAPTNTKTAELWLNFNAISSMSLLANIDRMRNDNEFQISSKEDGSVGAINVTGVSANTIESAVIGNATTDGDSIKLNILSADAKPMLKGSLVKIENKLTSEILRSYRSAPDSGSASETPANTTTITNYFRTTNSIKYLTKSDDPTKGIVVFYRNGMGTAQTEPLASGNNITLTNLGSGLVQITGAQASGPSGTGALSARVGDMAYFQPTSPFTVDIRCKPVPNTTALPGLTDGTLPEYLGYPVVHVIDSNNILILAPNITTFGTVSLTSSTDLVFMPAVWNEKNIRTNHQEGAIFDNLINNGQMYIIVKTLGAGMVSVLVQNSSSEATDDLKLDKLSVNTDDFVVLGQGFDPSNQGTFRLIAHNGRNHFIVYNPDGGTDEIFDADTKSNNGVGDRKWRVGPIEKSTTRPIRVIDAESVKLGDYFRISTPQLTTPQWFNSSFFGSWQITGIGYMAKNLDPVSVSASVSGSTVTITHLTPHGYTSGQKIQIQATAPIGGVSAENLSGIFVITVPTSTTYTYTIIATGSGSGTVNEISSTEKDGTYDQSRICPYVEFYIPQNPLIITDSSNIPVDKFLITGNNFSLGFTEGEPLTCFRQVSGHGVDPTKSDESNLFLTPKLQFSKMTSTFGTQVTALNKLGFSEEITQGVDGYKVFSGLVQQAHRIIDGLPTDSLLYPGVKAAGAVIEVLTPLIKSIQVDLLLKPKEGVTINSIAELVRASVASYINELGVGQPVILSELIKTVQGLPGVFSVTIVSVSPSATDDRITVSEIEKPFVLDASLDITIG
jgi:hypothetical protein